MKMGDDTPQDRAPKPKPTYEVGYCKPPAASRFKPGRSGNPKGRPKSAKNKHPALWEERLKSTILTEAYRSVKIRDGNKDVTLSMAQAIARSVAVSAAKGNARAQRLFLEILGDIENENYRAYGEYVQSMIDYKYDWEEVIERCKQQGLPVPEPIPHPDHIEIDFRTGLVHIRGPQSKEDKARWDKLRQRKIDALEAIAEARKELKGIIDPGLRAAYEEDIAYEQRMHDMIARVIKD
jgi:hypothetical protein